MTQANETFPHGFDVDLIKSVQGFQVLGYNNALLQVLAYLREVTAYKPENRYIDSVPLIQKISATLGQLTALYEKSKEDDLEKTNILSGTK